MFIDQKSTNPTENIYSEELTGNCQEKAESTEGFAHLNQLFVICLFVCFPVITLIFSAMDKEFGAQSIVLK